MKKTIFLSVIVALYSIVCTSCTDIVKGYKEYAKEHDSKTINFGTEELVLSNDTIVHNYNVGDFFHIITDNYFSIDVVYKQSDDAPSATLICNKELLPFVEVCEKNGILYINNTDNIRTYSSYEDDNYVCTLVCSSKKLTNIEQSGLGNIIMETGLKGKRLIADISEFGNFICKKPLELDELEINSSSSGNIKLCGTFKDFDLDISGFGNVNINGTLTAENLSIDKSGSGNIAFRYPTNINKLEIESSGFGNISIANLKVSNATLDISGSGNTLIGKIDAKSLKLNVSGFGDILIPNGHIDDLNLCHSGSGSFSADDMTADNVKFEASGFGDHTIGEISKTLDVSLHSSASLTYGGNPTLTKVDVKKNYSLHKK